MNFFKKVNINLVLKIAFLITSILFVMPSIVYLIKNGTVYKFDKWFCFLLDDSSRNVQTILYIIILSIMIILYSIILKRQKNIFKNIKDILIYTLIISSVYLCSITFTCSDVFYYLGIGRIDAKYNQNPYYNTITEFVDKQDNAQILQSDTVLAQGYLNDWANTTVVYGPLWTIICKIIAFFSLGNIDFGIFIFRLINIAIHILNCYLIYKILKKRIFSVMYGLNPYMLLEGIMCVHNDIFVICFIMLGIYFLIKKKNISLAVVSLAMATSIKYFAILLLPLFVIYYYRNEKLNKKILMCTKYGLFFIAIVVIPYLFYIKDITVLNGIFTQQAKFAKNFYIILIEYFTPDNLPTIINKTLLLAFVIIYFFNCLILLLNPKVKFNNEAKKFEYFLFAFLFLLITNFQPWYIMWLFPLMIWQKSFNIKLIIQISLVSQLANSIFLAYTEGWKNGTPFTFLMLLGTTICIYFNSKKTKKRSIK